MKHALRLLFAAILLPSLFVNADAPTLLYAGTYTNTGKSKGIYVFHFDPASGQLSNRTLAAEITSPSFLTIHPNHKYLYAVGETGDLTYHGKKSGAVTAFSIDPSTGQLTQLNQQPSAGAGPCYVATDSAGTTALVANYGSGSFASLPIDSDGRLREPASVIQDQGKGANPKRQDGPHSHSINLDAQNHFAFACDLGLDKIFVFRFDPAAHSLTANDPPFAAVAPGSGPRHFSCHPTGRYAYVINEMACTVTAFTYDSAAGRLSEIQTVSTLPPDTRPEQFGNTTAEVQVHPTGKFLYGSNRGHNSIATFTIDESTGRLTPLGQTPTGASTDCPACVCLKFLDVR